MERSRERDYRRSSRERGRSRDRGERERRRLKERLKRVEAKLLEQERDTRRYDKYGRRERSRSRLRRSYNSRSRSRDSNYGRYTRSRVYRSRSTSRSGSSSTSSSRSSRSRSRSQVSTKERESREKQNGGTKSNAATPPPGTVDAAVDGKGGDKTSDADKGTSEKPLSESAIQLIGPRVRQEKQLGPAIHSEIAVIWQELVDHGMPKEEREKILEKFPRPENCAFIEAPEVNLAVKKLVPQPSLQRDARIGHKQHKIAACISALATTITTLFERHDTPENQQLVEPLALTCRLLADLQHDESNIRRNLLIKEVQSTETRALLMETRAEGGMLFGSNLTSNVEDAAALKKLSKMLQPSAKEDSTSKNARGPSGKNRQYHSRSGGNHHNNNNWNNNWNHNSNNNNHRSSQTYRRSQKSPQKSKKPRDESSRRRRR